MDGRIERGDAGGRGGSCPAPERPVPRDARPVVDAEEILTRLDEGVMLCDPVRDGTGEIVDFAVAWMSPRMNRFIVDRDDLAVGTLLSTLVDGETAVEVGRITVTTREPTELYFAPDLRTNQATHARFVELAGRLLVVADDRTTTVTLRRELSLVTEVIDTPLLRLSPSHDGDESGRVVTYANAATGRLGIDPVHATGSRLGDLVDVAAWGDLLAVTVPGGRTTPTEAVLAGRVWEVSVHPADADIVLAFHDVTERERDLHALTTSLRTEPETGLLSVTGFITELDALLQDSSTTTAVVEVTFSRLEQLQRIHGLDAPRHLIAAMAEELRRTDAALVARTSDSSIALAFTGVRRATDALDLADEVLLRTRRQRFLVGHESPYVATTAAGVVMAPLHGRDADLLVRRLRVASFVARTGPRPVAVWTPELEEAEGEQGRLAGETAAALADDQFEFSYQPHVDLVTRVVTGCSLVVRWRHPTRGILPWHRFVRSVLISDQAWDVADLMFRRVAADAGALLDARPDLRIGMPSAPGSLSGDGIANGLQELLVAAGLPPSAIRVNFDESDLEIATPRLVDELAVIRRLDVHIGIDRIGERLGALGRLSRLDADVLTLDRRLVRHLERHRADQVLVRSIVEIAALTGARVIADGIETERELSTLVSLGCLEGQGFLLAPPLSREDAAEVLRRNHLD